MPAFFFWINIKTQFYAYKSIQMIIPTQINNPKKA